MEKKYSISFGLEAGLSKAFTKSFKDAGSAVSALSDKVNKYNLRAAQLERVINRREALEQLTRSYDNQRAVLERYTEAVIRARTPSARLLEMQEEQEKKVLKTQKAIDSQRESLRKLNEEMRTGGASTSFLREQVQMNESLAASYHQQMQRAQQWDQFVEGAKGVAKGAVLTAAAVTTELARRSIPTGAAFEEAENSSMRALSADERAQLKEVALSQDTKFGPSEYRRAMNPFVNAGYSASDSSLATRAAANMATISGGDLAHESQNLALALQAFNMKVDQASHATDVFYNVMRASKMPISFFTDAVNTVGFTASQYGMNLEELNSMVNGVAFVKGIDGSGSAAANAISNAIHSLYNPDAVGREWLQLGNVQTTDAKGNRRDFTDVLMDLDRALEKEDANDFTRNMTFRRIFGEGADLFIGQLIGYIKSGAYQKNAEIYRQSGTAEVEANRRAEEFNHRVARLNAAMERLQVHVFDSFSDHLGKAVDKLSDLIECVADFAQEFPKLTEAIVGVAAILSSSAALSILSKIKDKVLGGGAAKKAGEKIAGGAAMNVISKHPVGAAVAAVAAGLAALVAYKASTHDEAGAKSMAAQVMSGEMTPEEAEGGVDYSETDVISGGIGVSQSGMTVNFSPTINITGEGDAYADVKRGISESSTNLKRELEELLGNQRRLSFG